MDIRSLGNVTPADPGIVDKNVSASDATAQAQAASAPVQTAAAVQQPGTIPTLEQVTSAVQSINKALKDLSQGIEFSVDADTHRTVIKVVDQQTNQVIRQIPSEETLQIAKALDQTQGLLIRQKA